MSKNNSGRIVKTRTGKLGIIYNSEFTIKGKRKVHLIDENTHEPTGKKLLCSHVTLTFLGFID